MKELALYLLGLYLVTWPARAADKRRRNALHNDGLQHNWGGRDMVIRKGVWVPIVREEHE